MNLPLLIDLEYDPKKDRIKSFGLIGKEIKYTGTNFKKILELAANAPWICGHNIRAHDLPILNRLQPGLLPAGMQVIDTLLLSPLLRPDLLRHKLDKDYQIGGDERSDPGFDAEISGKLLVDLLDKWESLGTPIKEVFTRLLVETDEFAGFFDWKSKVTAVVNRGAGGAGDIGEAIRRAVAEVCVSVDFQKLAESRPVELAYCLALVRSDNPRIVTPSWMLAQFPAVQEVFDVLRARPCDSPVCEYCARHLSPKAGLLQYFNYPDFRPFEGDVGKPLQEQVVDAALRDESLLAVFPTGGGKSLTFQLPALMRGKATGALTVVISPLVSLMKDQVDVLQSRFSIVAACSINGMLTPLERGEAIEMVENGTASLLYISPESLRSATILRLLTGRMIDRFVIDEAHCFSAWGQDFRVDYGFIGKFLRLLGEKKMDQRVIPVSCFTATARPEVVTDIQGYFKKTSGLELKTFITRQQRENLAYRVRAVRTEEEKFERLVQVLEQTEGPAIVYASRVKTTEKLAGMLRGMQIEARHYNGKMAAKEKKEVQEAFKADKVKVIVATSAFGMGVDKADVGLVVHYEIAPSLENYQQEAGRAGRDKDLQAECVILYDESDLNQHFNILQGGKINQKDIDQIWTAIKDFKRDKISKSALEIARKAGWEQEIDDLETRVRTAVNALEEAGYIERLLNSPRVFADSMLMNNFREGERRIQDHAHQFGSDLESALRVLKSIMGKFRRDGETRVDYLADQLGIQKSNLATILNRFKDIGILGDFKDLSAEINLVKSERSSKKITKKFVEMEQRWLDYLLLGKEEEEEIDRTVSLREANDEISREFPACTMDGLRRIMEVWERQGWIRKNRTDRGSMAYRIVSRKPLPEFRKNVSERGKLAREIVTELVRLHESDPAARNQSNPQNPTVVFSLVALKLRLDKSDLFQADRDVTLYEKTLLYLNAVEAIDLKDGFLIFYTQLTIQRCETSNQKRYTKDDFKDLEEHYKKRVEQIHIVGEYAKKMLENYQEALKFSSDYFSIDYEDFLERYFPGRKAKKAISRPLTKDQYDKIFYAERSLEQDAVLRSRSHEILVAAGPGSGKTRVLVAKMASLLLLEDIHPRQFLMLAFSRPAAREFRERLYELVGGLTHYVDIFTYHGYAFRLLGKLGDLERSDNIVRDAAAAILAGEIPLEMVAAKNVIVLDESQDISEDEFALLEAIRKVANDPRLIAAGDDDQSIYEFRGSSSAFMQKLLKGEKQETFFLSRNYRSAPNLVDFANAFLPHLPPNRLKAGTTLIANKQENGELKLVRYQKSGLVESFCRAIAAASRTGTVSVLTATNEEAYFVSSRLRDMGVPAIRLASRSDFRLQNLFELKVITHNLLRKLGPGNGLITEGHWRKTYEEAAFAYSRSEDWPLCQRVMDSFAAEKKRKFRLDWLEFLRQIRLEDFYSAEQGKVLVSTMHKVKGKEFDEVFLLMDNFRFAQPETARVVYVAITRARCKLEIHTHLPVFDRMAEQLADVQKGQGEGQSLPVLTLNASLRDVVLYHFEKKYVNERIQDLRAGDPLVFQPGEDSHEAWHHASGQMVVRFSKKFKAEVDRYLSQGYRVSAVRVDHVVIWWNAELEKDVRVVLPEVELRLGK
jgi:ATP-dependent DNA helicase RecQ